jgi:hypothetical protein
MELKSSTTHRGLNIKMKIGGLEALDLIFSLILMAFLNLIIGHTSFGIAIVLGVPSFLLICLYVGKKNKPDDFLLHLLKFYLTPGFYSAAERQNQSKMNARVYDEKV